MNKKLISAIAAISLAVSSAVSLTSSAIDIAAEEKILPEVIITEGKITDSLNEVMSHEDENIPVYIWYNDINKDEIENRVENRIGFSADDIENEYSVPDNALLNELSIAANGNPNDNLKKMMESHMKMTADAREEEKIKTETYIKALNEENAKLKFSFLDKFKNVKPEIFEIKEYRENK